MIHANAVVSDRSIIHEDVEIGPFSIIHPNVHLESGVKIGSNCEIGIPSDLTKEDTLVVGEDSNIRSHSVIYSGTKVGKGFQSGHFCLIRENTDIGDHCSVGSSSQLQGDCSIGNFTRFHSNVHIGKGSKIGNFVWIFPDVLITNDPNPPSEECEECIVGDYVVICSKVLILPGIEIEREAFLSANSKITKDVPEGKVASGDPAKIICDASILKMKHDLGKKAYPWRFRYNSMYPPEIVSEWERELKKLQEKDG